MRTNLSTNTASVVPVSVFPVPQTSVQTRILEDSPKSRYTVICITTPQFTLALGRMVEHSHYPAARVVYIKEIVAERRDRLSEK